MLILCQASERSCHLQRRLPLPYRSSYRTAPRHAYSAFAGIGSGMTRMARQKPWNTERPQKRKSGSISMLQWNLDSRLLLKIFSMGTSCCLHQATVMRGSR